MKRKGNIWKDICSIENLILADKKARKGKRHQRGVKKHDKGKGCNIIMLHNMLMDRTYKTSDYSHFIIKEEKERLISRLPYFPDRIVHHAIMNKLVFHFTNDTYSCIKGKGIHPALANIITAMKDVAGTKYCLKLDIKKFYPSVDNDILKGMLRKRFKDREMLLALDEIIDSAKGLPLGNYLSQQFANFYLTPFDRWMKEVQKAVNYFRYMDDMVIFSSCKKYLHQLLANIKKYLSENLNLIVKGNYQVFLVAARGVDVLGYVIFHEYVLIRKRIKLRYIRMMSKNRNWPSEASYNGLFQYCKTANLIRTVTANSRYI